MIIFEVISFIFISFLTFIILGIIVIYALTNRYPIVQRFKKEAYYFDPISNENLLFPSINDGWTVHLSVIIPAYNEAERLPVMLDECLEFLEKRRKLGFTYEIIIVSDGSTDKTVEVGYSYAKKYSTIRVLALEKNRGKGGAVRLGMQSSRGCILLFADADGATKFSDLDKLEQSLKTVTGFNYMTHPEHVAASHAVICGSRAHLEEEEKAKRSLFRLVLMHGFHFLVWILCVKEVHDTQCGFKLLTRESARIIFNALHVERWAFDVEMLYIAVKLKIPVTEIAVNWTEIEGSKIVPFWSWLQMGKDLFFIWLRYKIGAWRIAKLKIT